MWTRQEDDPPADAPTKRPDDTVLLPGRWVWPVGMWRGSAGARACRRAGLPVHGFHRLRHSFGTHAALFGVNPWRLQAWIGARGSHVAAEATAENEKAAWSAA